jgi:hypothetical protein
MSAICYFGSFGKGLSKIRLWHKFALQLKPGFGHKQIIRIFYTYFRFTEIADGQDYLGNRRFVPEAAVHVRPNKGSLPRSKPNIGQIRGSRPNR